jgi:hypothetical protein
MSYKGHMEDYLDESHETRFGSQVSQPGIEIWPDESFQRLLNACAATSTVTGDQLMALARCAEQAQ